MAKRRPPADPHAEREAARYDNPIPSREAILELLDSKPLTEKQLAKELGLHDADAEAEEALRRRVRAMLRDKQLTASKSGRLEPAELEMLEGIVQANKDGFGFVLQEGKDIFLTAWQMQRVFDGDRVRVAVEGYDRRGRAMGNIVQVLERNTRQVVGRYDVRDGEPCVVCEGKVSHVVGLEDLSGTTPEIGDYVTVAITRQPEIKKPPLGSIVEVLGDVNHPGVATDVAIRQHDIPHEWPDEVEREARRFAAEPSDDDKKARVDLRKLPLITIDGEDARDFDDAVYCEPKKNGGWRLWVAIADVSHYVSIGSALDEEAQKRATSVYFPDRVVPMLPEVLSNGLCSLKPEVERLCMVCEMTVSAQGRLSGYTFYEGVMRSHARFTYNEVAALLTGEADEELQRSRRGFMPQLRDLHDLYKALRFARDQRGAIDFETVETKVVYDKQHRIAEIVPVQRNDAHKIIEECMLCANVATARLLEKSGLPALFRVHETPGGDKLSNLRTFLGEIGLNLGGGEEPSPTDFQALLQSVADRPDASVIQVMMLRSLKQAMYQPDNGGHFGLHYQAYAHFTSPIRRYPDLLVHRCIRYLLRSNAELTQIAPQKGAKKLKQSEIYPYDTGAMVSLGEHCSMAERRADDASRDVMAWLKCEYLRERVGETYEAIITAVTGFGFFAEMKPLYMEGLVHIGALGKDFYQFDAARQRLVGERNRDVFALGDSVSVQILSVDVENRKVELGLVDVGTSAAGKQRKLTKREQIARGQFDEKSAGKGGADKGRSDKKAKQDERSGPRKRRRKR
jgi:ribonuclease R